VVAPMKVTVPFSDVGQEGILLALLKRCHFVDEQYGAAALLGHDLGLLHRLADILDAGKHRRQRDELGIETVGHQARQRGLATPGGPQRIIECGVPEENARRSGLPSPSR